MIPAHAETFPPRAYLIHEETCPADVFSIIAGTVTLSMLLSDGRRRILGFAVPGDLIGLVATDAFGYSAQAADGVSAWRIRRSHLTEVAQSCSNLLQALHEWTLRELTHAFEHVVLLESRSAREKVAEFILSHEARWRAAGSVSNCLALPMSRQDMAGYLGLAPETLSRTLADLERLELIALAPQGLSILNRKRLMAAADGHASTPRRSRFDAMTRADDECSRSIRRRS